MTMSVGRRRRSIDANSYSNVDYAGYLSPEALAAIHAVEYISEHLKHDDQVKNVSLHRQSFSQATDPIFDVDELKSLHTR